MTVTMPAQERYQRAVATLEYRQQLSAQWQLALSDGFTDLVARLDFDLRERLRDVLEETNEQVTNSGFGGNWTKFDGMVRGRVEKGVRQTFGFARRDTQRLSERVAATLAGTRDGSHPGVALPKLAVPDPDEALDLIKPMAQPVGGDVFPGLVNSLRGSYGGILMVGVLTSLAGQQLISVYSVAAGVALGLFTWWEDRKNSKERRRAEAKMAAAKLVDDANFRVGEQLRTQLRIAHRTLRDHYTVINDQYLRQAAQAVNAAAAGR